MKRSEVENRAILVTLTGSYSYGTNVQSSDKDYKGIFIAPKEYYYGIKNIEQKDSGWLTEDGCGLYPELDGNKDTVFYELRKFVKLALNCNPNILELLFERDDMYLYKSRLGEKLITNRDLFLSKKVKYSYSGYGYSQLKKIKTHRHWLLNPVKEQPRPSDYGLEPEEALNKVDLNRFLEFVWLLCRDRIEFASECEELYTLLTERMGIKGVLMNNPLPPSTHDYIQELTRSNNDFKSLLHKTQTYRQAFANYKNYQNWKKNRNPARAAMEAKVGYDTKYSMHLIRLLNMGLEILLLKEVNVYREDAGMLLEIRNGEWE